MTEEFNSDKIMIDEKSVRSFMNKLKEKSENELFAIIARYISYKPEMVVGALTIAVDRGFISWDMKVQLMDQITTNYALHERKIKQKQWETKNAFTSYIAKFQDDELYNIIDDPSEIVIDVYHAVLQVAKERELISEQDFESYYNGAVKATRSEAEIETDEYHEIIDDFLPVKNELTETEIEQEKQKLWKCPSCGEIVDINLSECWNCQTKMPEIVEHPDREAVIREVNTSKYFDPVKTGLTITGIGVFIVLLTFARGHSFNDYWHFRYLTFGLGVLSALGGLIMLFAGIFTDKFKKDR